MATIAFLLLAHKAPDRVVDQARTLAAGGHCVAVHYDAARPRADFATLRTGLHGVAGVVLSDRRVRCGWGSWSLVRATLATAETALRRFPQATHLYLISGDCAPLLPAGVMAARLDDAPCDHIEAHPFFETDWIKTGLRAERVHYRHWFNERRHPGLFYLCLRLQQLWGLRRDPPPGIRLRIGAQWWCLRRETVEKVVAFLRRRRDVRRFFRSVWIPDEVAFQTLVAKFVPEAQISNRPPTLLHFTDYGVPVVFQNDHLPLLRGQEGFFVRKVDPAAQDLRQTLAARYLSGSTARRAPEGDGVAMSDTLAFLAVRGRSGARRGPEPWGAAGLPRPRLTAVVCKHWQVATRAVAALPEAGLRLGHVFDAADAGLPRMGGFASDIDTRDAHPWLTLRMAAANAGSLAADHVAFALDPSRIDIVRALLCAGADVDVQIIDTALTDGFLEGHGTRLGVLTPGTDTGQRRLICGALAQEVRAEIEAMLTLPAARRVPFPKTPTVPAPRALDTAWQDAPDLSRSVMQPQGGAPDGLRL